MPQVTLDPGVIFPLGQKIPSGPKKGFFPVEVNNMEMSVTQEKNETVIVNFSFEINKINLRMANVKLEKFDIMDDPSDPVTTGYLMTKTNKKQKVDDVAGLEVLVKPTDNTQNPVDIIFTFQAAGRKIGGGAGPLIHPSETSQMQKGKKRSPKKK